MSKWQSHSDIKKFYQTPLEHKVMMVLKKSVFFLNVYRAKSLIFVLLVRAFAIWFVFRLTWAGRMENRGGVRDVRSISAYGMYTSDLVWLYTTKRSQNINGLYVHANVKDTQYPLLVNFWASEIYRLPLNVRPPRTYIAPGPAPEGNLSEQASP